MRTPLLLCLCLPLVLPAAACRFGGYPPHEAWQDRDFEVPAAGLEGLTCETHNGGVRVTGGPGDQVKVRARVRARGWTQEEAEANLERVRLVREVDGGWLLLGLESDGESRDWDGARPSVSFTVDAPARLATRVFTHNGEVTVREVDGEVVVDTHNGEVVVGGAIPRVDLETHNGDILAEFSGAGPVAGEVETHNGHVRVVMGGRSARLAAHTHNGDIAVEADGGSFRSEGGTVRATVGGGTDELRVVTHNGSVVVR